jgi:hypothetical protein
MSQANFSIKSNLLNSTKGLYFGHALALVIGFLVFLNFFDLSILNPENTDWILQQNGDILQHQLGSMCFRKDGWYFPITLTKILNSPEGVSIVYTDSNILFSLIAKVFSFSFKPEYQFWGLWYLLCLMLQSMFAFRIIFRISENTIYSLLVAGVFCLMPTLFYRLEMGHSNLFAHWLILAVLDNLLNKEKKVASKDFTNWFILILSATVHGYLMIMCLIIIGLFSIQRFIQVLKSKRELTQFFVVNILGSISFILCLWILGYFYNKPINNGLLGFGTYSMNLNSLVNPYTYDLGVLLPELIFKKGQYEGYQYLGLGLIVLHAFFLFHYIVSKELYTKWWLKIITLLLIVGSSLFFVLDQEYFLYQLPYFVLLILFFILIFHYGFAADQTLKVITISAIIALLIACSNDIVIGNTRVLKIDIKEGTFLDSFFQMVRSSGRFYWLTVNVILILIFKHIYMSLPLRKFCYGILILIICIQLYDMSNYSFSKTKGDIQVYKPNEVLSKSLEGTSKVCFQDYFDITVCRDILLLNKTSNKFYMAHGAGKESAKRNAQEIYDFKHGNILSSNAYLMEDLTQLPFGIKSKVLKLDSFNYLFTNNLKSGYIKSNSDQLVFINDTLTFNQLSQQLKKDDLTLIININNDGSIFNVEKAPYESSSFPLKFDSDKNSIGVYENQQLVEGIQLKKNSCEVKHPNFNVSIQEFRHNYEDNVFLSLNGNNIFKLRSGISYLSIDTRGLIHLAHISKPNTKK